MPFKAGVWPIPKGRVKLPEPAVSDYIIPSTATASSENYIMAPDPTVTVSGDALTYSLDTTNKKITVKYVANKWSNSSDYVAITFPMDFTNILPSDTLILKFYAYNQRSDSRTLVQDGNGNTLLDIHNMTENVLKTYTVPVGDYAGTQTDIIIKVWDNCSSSSHSSSSSYNVMTVYYPEAGVRALNATDNDTSTIWHPSTTDPGKWIYIDAGAPKIISGVRIYWGSNVPNKFTVEVSTDATNWTPVYKQTIPPTPNAWQEIGFYATYARYIRIYLDDQGSDPVEIGEIQYYSSLVERVASEHGHGSGPEPWMRGANVRLRYVSKFANIQSRISSLQRDLQKSRTVNVKHVQELTGIVQDLKELVKLLHMS
ncbi:hypothetical protein X802_08510 [Thermococcus guaymasensis DSM 11113]|uniref:F5/8 type C domain-containing protein n=2 Tax=Thermococcus guaymasensis TaxID=110164 RepID=A0A0X1KNK5_9EURY|nr:hypothetical protein X802_08510 [Thermococcus guaymasensis DSM 11113]